MPLCPSSVLPGQSEVVVTVVGQAEGVEGSQPPLGWCVYLSITYYTYYITLSGAAACSCASISTPAYRSQRSWSAA